MAFAVIGNITMPTLVQARSHAAESYTPLRLTLSRIELNGFNVPKFSETIANPTIVHTLYGQARSLSTQPVPQRVGIYAGYPPAWVPASVGLEITFWKGSQRILTLVHTEYDKVRLPNHELTHLFRVTPSWLKNPFHNPYSQTLGVTSPAQHFLARIDQLLPMQPRKFFDVN
ncbi:MAG: hypothetical protein OWU84_11990 [Firmicutes bacterium]|nr:hypothetical protein [Bacillota bacterium]